jgi:hypothetical protein
MDRDDWKGESLIKRKPTREQQFLRGQSVMANLAHKKRQKNGTNMSKSGGVWVRRIRAAVIEARCGVRE